MAQAIPVTQQMLGEQQKLADEAYFFREENSFLSA